MRPCQGPSQWVEEGLRGQRFGVLGNDPRAKELHNRLDAFGPKRWALDQSVE
jgi:hypothetical protein